MKNKIISILILTLATLISCKKDLEKKVYDVTYGVDTVDIYSSNVNKTKQKSPEQFISILYSNLTNESIPADDLNHLSEVTYSIGDKGLVNMMLLENILNQPQIEIPTKQEMRNDVEGFVIKTYLKFYLRQPSEYEKYFFTSMIQNDTTISPEMVFSAFAQSNEYLFY